MEDLTPQPQVDFPIIGIGASAGGLEAVTTMFNKIRTDMGMAYVLVMHLDPNHESLMVELLSRKTQVEVRQIEDGDEVQINCLHVIPPGYSLSMDGPRLHLERFEEPRGLRRPIDSFFGSLAKTQGEKCACVVLSGTGADGTAGLRIGKDLGGVAAVQSPEEARYDGMPFSAISTNLIDFTLPAEEIIPRLRTYFDGQGLPEWTELAGAEGSEDAISQVFDIIQDATGNDFSGYKPSMLLRRMARRMQVRDQTDLVKYMDTLRKDTHEQAALAQDFLINVTSFFRDWEKFEIMRQTTLIPLIQSKGPSDEVRIWVPGCSSGQEAYSIAMMIDKTCEELQHRPLIQIFATDIDSEMLARARRGEYLISSFPELPKAYQESYTAGLDGRFEVIGKIREMVRFSYHNLIQDPPFSKIDLISCRNLMIYLGERLQSELFPVLHFSLRPGGHLFLGTSESITRQSDLFSIVDQNARVFRRIELGKRVHLNMPLGRGKGPKHGRLTQQRLSEERDFPEFSSIHASNDEVYQEYAPPFVRVTSEGRVIGSSGDLGLFLVARPGEERELFSLLREGVRDIAISLLSDATKAGVRVAAEDIEVQAPFGTVKADIIAHPMKDETISLVFIVQELLKPAIKKYAVAPVSTDKRVSDLQEQLSRSQMLLKAKVEEVETANEELKSSNEEMMSMNEELQSANEELTTANEELKNKIDELTLANADLDNFLGSADLAMIVLDRSLRIRHVTNAASQMLPIQQSDKGRFLTEFNFTFGPEDVAQEIRNVMETHKPFIETFTGEGDGKSFFMRITPYFFKDGSVEGATVTLTDISKEVALRHELSLETERLMLAMRAGRMGLAELDVEQNEVTVDPVLADHLHLKESGVVSMKRFFTNFVPEDVPLFEENLKHAIETSKEYEFNFRIRNSDGSIRWFRTRCTPYRSSDGRQKVVGPTLDITDVTTLLAREQAHSEELGKLIAELERSNRELDEFAYTASHDLKEPLRGIAINADFLSRLDVPEDGQKRIERMIELTKRMEQLVSDLLFFSRLGRGEKVVKEIDAKLIIEETIAELSEWMANHNGRVEIKSDVPWLTAERPQIKIVFQNLIVNGMKYNDADEKLIEVGFEESADVNGKTMTNVFYVRDNGIGIADEHRQKAFQIFKRINSESEYGPGIGAGLSFVRKIVEEYGCEIDFVSKQNGGTTFYFTLPLMDPARISAIAQ